MKRLSAIGSAALLIALASTTASATILTGSVTGGDAFTVDGGTFIKLTPPLANPFGPPNSVGNDTFQNSNLYGFDEDQNIFLAAPLVLNVGTSPIAAGTRVASHYIFFDPGPTRRIIATVNFDSTVLGIMTETGTLAAGDFLANTGVTYLNPSLRGLEPGDFATINGPNQIRVDFTAASPGDYIRVITAFSPAAAVPEPGAVIAGLSGLAAVCLRRLFGRRAR